MVPEGSRGQPQRIALLSVPVPGRLAPITTPPAFCAILSGSGARHSPLAARRAAQGGLPRPPHSLAGSSTL